MKFLSKMVVITFAFAVIGYFTTLAVTAFTGNDCNGAFTALTILGGGELTISAVIEIVKKREYKEIDKKEGVFNDRQYQSNIHDLDCDSCDPDSSMDDNHICQSDSIAQKGTD